jgi:hypothetical protein
MLLVYTYDRFPYFVSTHQVGFIVFSGAKAGFWWLHLRTMVTQIGPCKSTKTGL